MKTIIHVHQQRIRNNKKNKTKDPPIIVRTYKEVKHVNIVEIHDEKGCVIAKLIYRPNKPLSCGARVWLETEMEVVCK